MDGSAIKELERIVSVETFEVGGQTYSPVRMHPVYNDPRPTSVGLRSLTALRDFIASNIDGLDLGGLMLIVADHRTVQLKTNVYGPANERTLIAEAEFSDMYPFSFGEWLDQEDFIIRLRSLFVQTDGLIDVIEYASRVEIKDESVIEDDGVTQSATVRVAASGAMKQKRIAPSIVSLQPYRTFTEIEQPESQFLFRMHRDRQSVRFALFEADGGAWMGTARQRIAAWLNNQLADDGPVVLA